MHVFFTCDGPCGAVKEKVDVPDRAKSVDIKLWMGVVMQRVSFAHMTKLANCTGKSCDLHIPLNGPDAPVGEKLIEEAHDAEN